MQAWVLMSHQLTDAQVEDLCTQWGVSQICYPAQEVQSVFSAVPPEPSVLSPLLDPIFSWLREAEPDDVVVVQGEFGMVLLVVQFAWIHGLCPIYATTARHVVETRLDDGRIHSERLFKHVRFRAYERLTQ